MKSERPLAQYFDHTLLKPDATRAQILRLCEEAKTYGFYAVCVNSSYTALCAEALAGSPVKVATVVGFPLGACATQVKVFETQSACRDGAAEIDMVLNVGLLKDGQDEAVKEDIAAVVRAASACGAIVKVILEICLLTPQEIVRGCRLAQAAGAGFVKTSTGFSTGGATVEAVRLMRQTVGPAMGVKASGGIRDRDTVLAMIAAGADRIGASASVSIMEASI